METYTIKKRRRTILSLICWILISPFLLWIATDLDTTTRSGRNGFAVILYLPIYISILIYELFHSSYPKGNTATLSIGSKRILIYGNCKTSVDLEWKKIEKIDVINGLTTKIVFHFKYKTEEVHLYSYQRTYKLIKALKHFGNGVEVIERKKIFKILYIPFW